MSRTAIPTRLAGTSRSTASRPCSLSSPRDRPPGALEWVDRAGLLGHGKTGGSDEGGGAVAFRVGITRSVLGPDGRPIFGEACFRILDEAAVVWEIIERDEPELSPDAAARYDALCVMVGRVTRRTLSPDNLRTRLIARFGVGYDSVDVPACTEQGVLLTIAPDGVRRPVATNAITFVLALAQKLLVKHRLTSEGRWEERLQHIGMGLTGRTLGAVGMGNIGAELFRLAAPFDMRHLACDPRPNRALADELRVELVDLDTLLRTADFVCVMCPLDERTRGLVGRRELTLMKPTSYLINTARGPIVDEKALYETLAARRIAGAGLDVFTEEPTPADNPILRLDNVIVTPHSLCFTDECLDGLARSAFAAAATLARGRVPPYVVNLEVLRHPRLGGLERSEDA
jgi:phosphoglycerate dehydrogenase-like enzyme